MCDNIGSIVVVVTGCSKEEGGGIGVVGQLFSFTFGDDSIIDRIYFVLLPGNREARVRIVHPLAREWIGSLLVVLVWEATMQQCRATKGRW